MTGSPGGKNVGRLALKVLPDTSEFLDELKAFAERVEKEVRIELDVDLNVESASEELKSLQAHLEIILAAMQGTADMHPVNVDVDVDGQAVAAVTDAMNTGAGSASRMGTQIAMWGPLIFIAAAGIAALAPALLVLFPLVAGLGLGLSALIMGASELQDVLQPIYDAFGDMREEVSSVLTAGLRPLIAELTTSFIPVLKDGLLMGAQFMNTLLTSLLEFLNSTEGLSLMSELFAGLGPALEPLAQAMGPLVELFVRLSIAALPGLQMMSEAILRVVEDLNKWLGANDISDDIALSMSQLGDVLGIVGRLARDIFAPLVASAPAVIGGLSGVGEALGDMFQVMQPLFEFMSQHVGTMQLLGYVLTVLAVGIGIVAAATAVWNAVLALNPISLIIVAVIALVAGLIYAYNHFEAFRVVVDTVFQFVKTVVMTVVAFILEHWRFFATALLTIIAGPIGLVVGLIATNFGAIKSTVVNIFNAVVSFLRGAWDKIQNIFDSAMNAAKLVVATVMGAIKSNIDTVISGALATVRGISSVGTYFSNAFTTAKKAVTDMAGNVRDTLSGFPGKVVGWLGNVGSTLASAGRDLIQGFINGIGDKFGDVKNKLGDLTSKLTSWKGPESLDRVILFGAGQLVIGGFLRGLESEYDSVESSLGGFTDSLADMANFDGEVALKFSGASGVVPQLDSLLSLGADTEASRIIIENWDTGLGKMQQIADESVEGYEASTESRTPPREDLP
jgi:phage-related protein